MSQYRNLRLVQFQLTSTIVGATSSLLRRVIWHCRQQRSILLFCLLLPLLCLLFKRHPMIYFPFQLRCPRSSPIFQPAASFCHKFSHSFCLAAQIKTSPYLVEDFLGGRFKVELDVEVGGLETAFRIRKRLFPG